jgi:hypothetical protein
MDHSKHHFDSATDSEVGGEQSFAPLDDCRLVRLGSIAMQCSMLRV